MEQKDGYIKGTQAHTKRFVVEDSITKVTSDGEPHEMMTMVAALSGLFAAVVILAVLASLVGCKRKAKHCKNCPNSTGSAIQHTDVRRLESLEEGSLRSVSITNAYTRTTSNDGGDSIVSTPVPISIISNGNLSGNLNSAFVGSELNLSDKVAKQKKRAHWSAEVEAQAKIKETAVDI